MISKHVKIIGWFLLGAVMVSFGIGNGLFISQKFSLGIKWFFVGVGACVILMVVLLGDFLRWRRNG